MPKVRLAAIILKDNKEILLGKIKGSYEDGRWTFPGGELEFGESYHRCFFRELWSTLGIRNTNVLIRDESPSCVTSDISPDEHYITLFIRGESKQTRNVIGSKDKGRYSVFDWFEWNNLPEPLSTPIKNLLKQNYCPYFKED